MGREGVQPVHLFDGLHTINFIHVRCAPSRDGSPPDRAARECGPRRLA